MKKQIVGIIAAVCLGSVLLTGCKVTHEQIIVMANEAGLFASVGWIAIDNPSMEVKEAVITVLESVKQNASMVVEGHTYTEILYPEIVKIIDKQIDIRYRPLCKAASITLLGQLDLLFVMHPEWKEDESLALSVTLSFIDGAQKGLILASNDPINIQARRNLKNRTTLINVK